MNKNITKLFLLASLLFLIVGCSPKPEFELYEGKELSIAVLGKAPEVKEEQVDFQEITFDEFNKEGIMQYDAVFIMKENLAEAAESQYAPVYKESHLPFFFIETNTGAFPFVEAEQAYDESREIPYHNHYATGFLEVPNGEQRTSTFGLDNGKVTKENIKDVYSRIFKTVEESSGD
ncbi:hypothetical protein [Planococcus sp. CAU13]|uniref:hypothetical protein n=1 Tax=Planococcus sp. CAU13 TaxID=1541197 RepID=UPI00052FEC99|nr:hypothetical protein [Planococcus sp. CAU13]